MSPRTILATLAALALTGLAALPHAARAQSLTLNSGDAATVSGAGTVGTIGGTPVANTTTSYSGSPAVQTNGTSVFTLATGGTLTAGFQGVGLDAFGSSTVTVNGGSITAGDAGTGLLANGSSSVTVTGGSITAGQGGVGLFTFDSSTVTISGGSITAGQGGFGLAATNSSTVNLFSLGDTPFLINGVAMNNTTLGQYTSGNDTISGTLLDGETLNTTFFNNATLNLNIGTPPAAAPEPSQFAAFAVGLLGLGVLTVKARRRAA